MSNPPGKTLAPRRSDCPICFALGIFGDRWSLLVLRDLLMRGKRRFGELLASPEGIATNVLSDRLRRLAEAGMVTRQADSTDQRQYIYRPTQRAVDLVPMLVEMIVWAARNDADTGTPPQFIERFYEDRQGLIDSIQRRALNDGVE